MQRIARSGDVGRTKVQSCRMSIEELGGRGALSHSNKARRKKPKGYCSLGPVVCGFKLTCVRPRLQELPVA